MVGKSYLRYEAGPRGGVIVSPQPQSIGVLPWSPSFRGPQGRPQRGAPRNQRPDVALVLPVLDELHVRSGKTGDLIGWLAPSSSPSAMALPVTGKFADSVSCILCTAMFRESYAVAAGFASGRVALFTSRASPTVARTPSEQTYTNTEWVCRFVGLGHRLGTSVLSLALDPQSTTLLSGGQDTDIAVWDLASHEAQYRLRGHRGGVVGVDFLSAPLSAQQTPLSAASPTAGVLSAAQIAVSAAADGLLKVWNLSIQQCTQTIVASDTQLTSMLVLQRQFVFAGLRDRMVRVYRMRCDTDAGTPAGAHTSTLEEHGVLQRKEARAATAIVVSPDSKFLAIISAQAIEFFEILGEEKIKSKLQRKRKRRERKKVADGEEGSQNGDDPSARGPLPTAAEEFAFLRAFRFDEKVRAATFLPALTFPVTNSATPDHQHHSLCIAVTFNNNLVTAYTAHTMQHAEFKVRSLSDLKVARTIDHEGHRDAVVRLLLSSDDSTLVSVSKDGLKLWGVSADAVLPQRVHQSVPAMEEDGAMPSGDSIRPSSQLRCIGSLSMEAGNEVLCATLLPGDELVAIGLASGMLMLAAIRSQEFVFQIKAHEGAVKDATMLPDFTALATIGMDCRVLHWEICVAGSTFRDVSLRLALEMALSDAPLALAYAPNNKLGAVALQDHSVQLFFTDTQRPFLSLYGHKLPVSGIAFSSDSAICATVSMDKNLRLWGTDFGDCHRAIHAHDDYITAVGFVRDTHFLFTASLDGTVKEWDADYWTMVQCFRLSISGLSALAISADGSCVVGAGKDRCVRVLFRTEEPLFPEEEEELIAQEAMDEESARRAALHRYEANEADVGVAGQKTASTTEAAERLMEALDNVSRELQRREASVAATTLEQSFLTKRHRSVWCYLWEVVDSIRACEMRHVVEGLTGVHTAALLEYLDCMCDDGAIANYEIAAKMLLALVKPAPGCNRETGALQFLNEAAAGRVAGTATPHAGLPLLRRLRQKMAAGLQRDADRTGFVRAGMTLLRHRAEEAQRVRFFDLSKVSGARKKFHARSLTQALRAPATKSVEAKPRPHEKPK